MAPKDAVFALIRDTIVDVLDLEDGDGVTETTAAADIDEWDSLQHVRILTAIEKKFGFRFTNAEIEQLKNVGDLVAKASERATVGV